jgi:hypothetical protein
VTFVTQKVRPRGIRHLATEEQWELLSQVAEGKQIHVNELARRVWDEALEKLQHVERSRPKREGGSTFGAQKRPKITQIVLDLRTVYEKLRKEYGAIEFEVYFGRQCTAFEAAVARADVAFLEQMVKDKPWIIKKW